MEVNLNSDDEHSEDSDPEEFVEAIDTDGSDGEGEGQPFDITLTATHSYMGSDLEEIGGRNILEAGWEGEVPALPHHSCVFPGETVPMLINNHHDAGMVAEHIQRDKLFALLFPDESGTVLSGYGVVCSVFEARVSIVAGAVTFKARAAHRARLAEPTPPPGAPRVRRYRLAVLPERTAAPLLRHVRLASLDSLRPGRAHSAIVRTLDAAVTPWPGFVYELFNLERMRVVIKEYFRTLDLEHLLPSEPVSLSFWVASNLTLSARDRLALFLVDDALLRLHMECTAIARKSILCCSSCSCEIARRDNVFAMSTDGVNANYTNLGGFMHDVVTVTTATNTVSSGPASGQYSWFPGYAWRVALCAGCSQHVGWRFTAIKKHLKPHAFYGLCRNYVTPREVGERDREI